MSFYDHPMYLKGPEAGGGGAFSAMRICSSGSQSQPQVEPKQPPTQSVQGGIPMGYPQQSRPVNQLYATRPTPRLPQRTPPMISGIQTSNIQYQSTPPTMLLHTPYAAAPLIIQHPQSIPPGRNQNHGGGQGGGAGGAPPGTYYPSQQPIFSMQSLPFQYAPTAPYMYSPQMRNNSFGGPTSGPHPGAPSQQPPQQQTQQFVVDPNVTGSGGGGGPGGGNATVLMQHPPPQQPQPPQPRRRRNALPITDPFTGRNIMEDIYSENQTESGESTSSATTQSTQNGQLAAEFAARVAAVAADGEIPGPTSSGASGTVNGPSTPPPQQLPTQVPAVEEKLPPSVHPPPSAAAAQNQRSSDLGPSPQPQPQRSQPQQCLNQATVIQASTVQPNHPAAQSHPPHHLQHHQQVQIPPQQIPTVSAKTDSPAVELPRSKAPTTAHSPGRKPTPVPPVQPPVLDLKKKDKKVTGLGSTLAPHREEPEEVRKSSFAETINIKNFQPTPVPIPTQLPPPQAPQVTPSEPETNGEPELPPPNATPAPQPSQTTSSKHHDKQEQHQTQHERGGKALQRQKQKKKANMKELNRRGQEKEGGTDMDAFTSSAPAEVSPPSPPASSSPGPVPSVAAMPTVQPAASEPVEPAVVENSPQQTAPLSSQPAPEPRQPSPAPPQQTPAPLPQPPPQPQAPVSQTIIPPPSNKNVDNEQDEGLEDMDEEEEVDEDSLLVAKKNEENVKAFLAPTAELDERIVIQTAVVERSKAPSLKYTYKEGQWSPLNPEGKKVYDREFLLNLRSDDLSTKRPDIDDCDIIKTDSTNNNNSISATNNNRRTLHGSNSMSMNRGDGFAPTFMRSSSSQRGGGMAYSKRGSQQGRPGGGGGGRSKGMYPSSQYKTEAEEELHWASKGGGWKPERCKTPPKLTEDELKTENLYKRVRGILNKLTPQKFEKLMEQIIELPIDTHERLKGVVELVFDKAVDEPSFSRAYAKLCQNLGKLVIKEGNENNDSTSFRKILLTRCQQMFEKKKKEETGEEGKKSDDERIAELQKQVTAEENKEKKRELQLVLEEEERKIRVKYVGLARFIGELFKLNMLTANIMHGCIKTLLEKIEEESLECLCKLLTTVGKELETLSQKENKDLEEYFMKMKKLSQKSANSKVSSRVRFMLQDVIELRSNKWIPRRDENNPKTMEQIQKDAERETMMESALLQSSTPRSKHSDRDDRRRGGPRGGGGNIPQDADGWHISTNNKFRNYTFEPSKLQHIKGMDNEPAGGLSLGSYGQFSQWNSGSNAKRSGGEPKRPEYSNKFALLGTDDKKMAPPMMSRKATPSSSLEKERAVQGVREVLGDRVNRSQSSNPPSRDSSRVRGKPGTTTPQAQTPVAEPEQPVPREIPPMDPDACKKKARELFDEWILNHNVQETVDSIKESFSNPAQFVKSGMDIVLEGKEFQRAAFADLLAALLAKDVISADDVSKELSEWIEIGEDLMIDLPLFWTYLAQLLVPILSKGVFTFANLKVACESCRTPYLSKTLAEIISQMLKSKGPGFIRTQWETSKVKFSDFIPETDVDNFIKTNNCGFLIGEGEVEASEPVLPMNEVEKILYDFLIQDGEKVFDHVCEWVKANVGAKSQDVEFIRSLTRAVIKACIKNNKIVPGSLNKYSTLIKKFVDANETRELACLSGIHHLIVVQMMSPAGVLLEIFQTLYEHGIISHEGFIKWKTCNKNEECKGVALVSLSSFFVSLSERDDSDDEST